MEEKKIGLLEGRERFEKPIFTSQDEAINKVPSKVDELEPTFNEEKNCVVDQSVSFLQLFRFASQFDMILIVTSVICAAASGVSFLMSIIYYGDILNSFITKDFTDEEINTMRCNGTNATVWPVNSTEMQVVNILF